MRIGAYEIEGELGRGGAGTVYRGRAPDGRAVAVKVLRAHGPDALARFERESRLARALGAEEGFVPILDSGVERGSPYLVMPIVAGGTLGDRLERAKLGIAETVALGRALAKALGHAHARGVVHRDVKPENVLFTAGGADAGRPLLADLGIAKHFDRAAEGASQSAALTGTDLFKGTGGYMPMEQLRGTRELGPPADVFALGCVLYECLAGRQAFEGKTLLEIVTAVEAGRFAPLRTHRADVPPPLAACIERALAREARDRFADGYAFERALAAAAKDTRGRTRERVVGGLLLAAAVVAVVAGLRLRGGARRDGVAPVASRPVTPPAPPLSVKDLHERAYRHWKTGERDAALADASRALELDPRCPEAVAVHALASHRGKKVDAATLAELVAARARAPGSAFVAAAHAFLLADVDAALSHRVAAEALALDPRCPLALLARAASAIPGVTDQDAHELGLSAASRAIELDPQLALARLVRAGHLLTKDDPGWRADVERAIELAPGDADMAALAGAIASDAGDLELGLRFSDRSLERAPRSGWVHLSRARLDFRRGEGHEPSVLEHASRAIELDADLDDPWLLRSLARGKLGVNIEGAIADATRYMAFASTTMISTRHHRGTLYARIPEERWRARKDFEAVAAEGDKREADSARAWLAELPEKPPTPPPGELEPADIERSLRDALTREDLAAAGRLSRALVCATPASARAWELRGRFHRRAGDMARALEAAQQAVDLDPDFVAAMAFAIDTAMRLNNPATSNALATWFVARHPEESRSWQALGLTRLTIGDKDGALAAASAGLWRTPHDANAWHIIGTILGVRGENAAAIFALERCLELGTDESVKRPARELLEATRRRR